MKRKQALFSAKDGNSPAGRAYANSPATPKNKKRMAQSVDNIDKTNHVKERRFAEHHRCQSHKQCAGIGGSV